MAPVPPQSVVGSADDARRGRRRTRPSLLQAAARPGGASRPPPPRREVLLAADAVPADGRDRRRQGRGRRGRPRVLARPPRRRHRRGGGRDRRPAAAVLPRVPARPRRHRRRPGALTGRAMATATGTATDLRPALERTVGAEPCRDDAGALLTFSTDATPLERGRPDVVVFPASTDEVAAIVRVADERRIPVVPRGSGTNLSAGTGPHRGGIVLVLTRMNALKE